MLGDVSLACRPSIGLGINVAAMPPTEQVKRAFFCGAGASSAAPARRPRFPEIRSALTRWLRVELEDEVMKDVAPEALLSRLRAAGVDIDRALREILEAGDPRPNALHFILAAALRAGHAVWTTNFDELIEGAARWAGIEVHVLVVGDDPTCNCGMGHLLKPHGTLGRSGLIARSEDVLAPLPKAWSSRLMDDFRAAQVGIVGYAGADIDIRPSLVVALESCNQARWFATNSDQRSLEGRFDSSIANGKSDRRSHPTSTSSSGRAVSPLDRSLLTSSRRRPKGTQRQPLCSPPSRQRSWRERRSLICVAMLNRPSAPIAAPC